MYAPLRNAADCTLNQSTTQENKSILSKSDVLNPATFITGVLAKYARTKSLVGKIVLTVSAEGKSQETTTIFQYQRPNKLYINQSRPAPKAGSWIVTSDGMLFSYPTPALVRRFKGQRMVEEVAPEHGVKLDIASMYGVTLEVLPDFSAPLSISISYRDELVRILHRWLTMKYLGKGQIDGKEVYRIGGDYSELYNPPPTGKYEIDITPSGNIKRYSVQEYIGVPKTSKIKAPPVLVTEVWNCNLQRNAEPKASLFKVLLNH